MPARRRNIVVATLFSMSSDDAWNEPETNDTRLGMEWTRDKTLELLREYQQRRVLWDWNARGYRDRTKRKRAIQELAEILCCNTLEIEKKITNLKCQYSREVHKIQNSRDAATGPDDVYVSKWFAFKAMQFLQFGTRRYSKRKKVGSYIAIDRSLSLRVYITSTLSREKSSCDRYFVPTCRIYLNGIHIQTRLSFSLAIKLFKKEILSVLLPFFPLFLSHKICGKQNHKGSLSPIVRRLVYAI